MADDHSAQSGAASRAAMQLESLLGRQATCWAMAKVFLENQDAHGLMDIGAELQSLRIAILAVMNVIGAAAE